MSETGFVTHVEHQKHIRGEWRTVHDLWSHIRHYVTKYAQPGGFTQGSVPFADASGFLIEDNPNLFWDAANARLGIHETTPTALVHINSVGGAIPALNLESGAEGELVTPDGQQLRFGHWNGVDTFTERMKIDATGAVFISYLTTGSVIIAGAGGEIKQDNAKFFYDVANHWLALGHAGPTNILHVSGVGTTSGWGGAYGGVVARFHCTENKHVTIAIDAKTGYDPILALSENGACIWGVRNDASETDEFQIRYHVGGANRTDFKIDNAGNVEILTGYLGIRSNEELRFYDNGNYVGFKAPALGANKIWVLPAADGALGEALVTDGAGNLSWAAGGAGEANTASNQGSGVSVYYQKAGVDLQFNAIKSENNRLAVALDGITHDIELTLVEGNIDHDALLNTHANPYKLDDLAAPDDNADLDFSTAKHGLVPKGTDVGHFLKDDGTWAAGGGGGAVVFPDLTDTPANYAGAANKIVKVNATPDALEFGADIEDLEDVDTIVGQAGKFAKVKIGDAGIEWAAGGNGGGYGAEVIDEVFDALINGDIDGQGVYSGWGAWDTDIEAANCSAEIVANPGNGKMLRLADANVAGLVQTRLDADAGHEIAQCLFKCKMRISTLAHTNNRGYIGFWDKAVRHTGLFFRDNFLSWYTGAATVNIVAAVANTWYDVIVFMDCTAGKAVIWVDDVLRLTAQVCQTQDIESITFYTKLASPAGEYTVDFDDLLIVDLTRKA